MPVPYHDLCKETEQADLKAGEEEEEAGVGDICIFPESEEDSGGSCEEKEQAGPGEKFQRAEVGDDADDESEEV